MLKKVPLAFAFLALTSPIIAAGAKLPFSGAFGDASVDGCKAYKEGREGGYFGTDPDGTGFGMSGEMSCKLKNIKEAMGGGYMLSMTCQTVGGPENEQEFKLELLGDVEKPSAVLLDETVY